LWIDNTEVSKADDVVYYDRSIRNVAKLPKRAHKEIVTRRDGKVCEYCGLLEGLTAGIGQQFNTFYGMFQSPPFHPRCRCFMIISGTRAA
jgi:hypothetical protein